MNIGEYLIHLSCYDDTDYGTSNVTFIINRNITAEGDHEGKVLCHSWMPPFFPIQRVRPYVLCKSWISPPFPTNTFIEKNPEKIEILKNNGFIAPLNY